MTHDECNNVEMNERDKSIEGVTYNATCNNVFATSTLII